MWLFLSGFCFHHLVGVFDELAKAVEDEIRNPRAKRAEDHNTKTKNDGDGRRASVDGFTSGGLKAEAATSNDND